MSRCLWVIPVALASGCFPRQAADQSEVLPGATQPTERTPLRCSPSSDRTIATLAPSKSMATEAPCGVALELHEGELVLRSIRVAGAGPGQVARAELAEIEAIEATGEGAAETVGAETVGFEVSEGLTADLETLLATGPMPERCGDALERCELWGVHDELGPFLLAAVRGHESEVPVQVYVGWVEDRRLVFAPTWYGLSSVVDHTRVGSPWALAPYDCDGSLALLPAPRLPEAAVEGPSEAAAAAAGRWAIGEDGVAAPIEATTTFDAASCRPVFPALP